MGVMTESHRRIQKVVIYFRWHISMQAISKIALNGLMSVDLLRKYDTPKNFWAIRNQMTQPLGVISLDRSPSLRKLHKCRN